MRAGAYRQADRAGCQVAALMSLNPMMYTDMTKPGEAERPSHGRSSERMRTFMAARILFNKGMMQADHTVRDLSDGGAKLEISGAVTLPEEFDLVNPQKNLRRRVRLCWRQDDARGARFVTGDEPAEAASASAGSGETKEQLRASMREPERTIKRVNARITELTSGLLSQPPQSTGRGRGAREGLASASASGSSISLYFTKGSGLRRADEALEGICDCVVFACFIMRSGI